MQEWPAAGRSRCPRRPTHLLQCEGVRVVPDPRSCTAAKCAALVGRSFADRALRQDVIGPLHARAARHRRPNCRAALAAPIACKNPHKGAKNRYAQKREGPSRRPSHTGSGEASGRMRSMGTRAQAIPDFVGGWRIAVAMHHSIATFHCELGTATLLLMQIDRGIASGDWYRFAVQGFPSVLLRTTLINGRQSGHWFDLLTLFW
jgi:hypothetical protein